MPIPPRPIPSRTSRPTHTPTSTSTSTRATRPGYSVPHKAPSTSLEALSANSVEWRAEVALLEGLPKFQAHRLVGSAPGASGALTVPGAGTGVGAGSGGGMGSMGKGTGVMLVDAAERARVEGQVAESARRREGREVRVDLEGLIEQGKGKREKRVTTATSLGFDFIPNPAVLALPDAPSMSPRTLTAPTTPALIPSSSSPLQPPTPIEGEADEDWEYVSLPPSYSSRRSTLPFLPADETAGGEDDEGAGDEDDGDMILLGEMDLGGDEVDDLANGHAQWAGQGSKRDAKAAKGRSAMGVSYAAALRRVR